MRSAASRPSGLAIRWRLTIWITAAFILTIVTIFIVLRLALGQILYRNVNSDLSDGFNHVQGSMVLNGALDAPALASTIQPFPFPVVVRGPDGTLLQANEAADAQAMALSQDVVLQITVEQRTLDKSETIKGEAFRVRSERLQIAGTVRIVQLGRSTQSIDDVMSALDRILLGGGLASTLVVLGVGYFLARNALRPVERMTQTAAEIEASGLTRRIAVSGKPTEIQRLADTFDAMLARLENAFAQQRNFVMDVSHELRTPLTGLRGNLDVMLMDKNLDTDSRAQLERMSAEVGRLIRLTSNLLYLAHAEAGREIARRPVELDALCLEVVYQARSLRSDVGVRLDHEAQVTVSGDRDLLKQLILNLVDNAIKFSQAGGDVSVSLYEKEDAAEIVVSDQGLGIPPDQLEKIFERLYRGTDPQSRTVGGAGIGLAISRWIARVHGGDIRVESKVGNGSRFIVTLPLSREESKVAVS
jgi:two-component system, OmpR family, sensor kinase